MGSLKFPCEFKHDYRSIASKYSVAETNLTVSHIFNVNEVWLTGIACIDVLFPVIAHLDDTRRSSDVCMNFHIVTCAAT